MARHAQPNPEHSWLTVRRPAGPGSSADLARERVLHLVLVKHQAGVHQQAVGCQHPWAAHPHALIGERTHGCWHPTSCWWTPAWCFTSTRWRTRSRAASAQRSPGQRL